jgi:hypothetical protein
MNRIAGIGRIVFFVIAVFFAADAARAHDGGLTITGEAGFSNIFGADDGKTGPYIKYTADASASAPLGLGTIGAALELQFIIDLQEATSNGNNLGDNFVYAYYALVFGPGELTLALKQSTAFSYWNLEPSLGYGGIDAGFATMDFDLWYDHKFSRKIAGTTEDAAAQTAASNRNASRVSLRHPHPDGFDDEGGGTAGGASSGGGGGASVPAIYGGGGLYSDKVGFNVSSAFDFGLNFQYGFSAGLNKNDSGLEVAEAVYIDLNYRINDLFQIGLELDDTGKHFSRFTLNPYGTFYANENTAFGFNLYFRNINSDTGSVRIGPSIWAMYSF